ncbi:MAG: DinB family protein [Luteitalea sp.]|nr:DinB family protein [Luteitalea sp.]
MRAEFTALSVACVLTCVATAASGQTPEGEQAAPATASSANPMTDSTKRIYDATKQLVLRSLEKMPEDQLGFKPVDTVRSYGQIVGHIADANYMICGMAAGEMSKPPDFEKTATTRADLTKALNDAFAHCDKIYGDMTDAKGSEMLPKTPFGEQARLSMLAFNNMHTWEHYGNLITYMRIKGIVPPSSEQQPGGEQ